MSNDPDLDDIERRIANLRSWLTSKGDTTAAEVLCVDVPALVAELRDARSRPPNCLGCR